MLQIKMIQEPCKYLNRNYPKTIATIVFVLFFNLHYAALLGQQRENVEQIVMFGNVLEMPIEMVVEQNEEEVVFIANNKSYFPYEFELRFTEFTNLNPPMRVHRTILEPGISRLFVLRIANKGNPYNYKYTISYDLGNPYEKVDLGFPYLVPIGEGKKVEFTNNSSTDSEIIFTNHFKMNLGDTIYSIRKGFVTALPDGETKVERIVKNSSFEVRHLDGSVAVYIGMDSRNVFAQIGKTIYPGQPLSTVGRSEGLSLYVYEFKGKGTVKSFEFLYSCEPGQLLAPQNILGHIVKYPIEIIEKEMTNKEKKKMQKGTLYGKNRK